jgi:hypothetical protein
MTNQEFNKKVEAFMKKYSIAPSRFGRDFVGDANFVAQMRDGREAREKNRSRILENMDAYEKQQEAAKAANG